MRVVLIFFALVMLSACEGSFFSSGDRWHTPRIDEAASARDACLAKNAAVDSNKDADANIVAREVAQACAPETEKLVQISNRDGDVKVAASIRENSEFRAKGYVLKARGQPIF